LTQYHHIDESGDPGLSSKKKGSTYFVIAMVQLPSRNAIIQFADLRRELHLPVDFEFHYKKMSARQKACFFEAISKLPYRARSIYLDKDSCSVPIRSLNGLDLTVELITQLVLRASPLDIAEDILVLDAAPPLLRKKLRVRLTEECQRTQRIRPFKKIVSAASSSEEGLQLADMLAGAIRQHILRENDVYYATFENRVVDLYWLR
jgi:Protein of unknown function (DUF3800)